MKTVIGYQRAWLNMYNNRKLRHSKKQKTTLNVSMAEKVINLFEQKGWEIEDSLEMEHSLFNRFCVMLESLTEEQQELVLELSENFLRIALPQYSLEIKNLLIRVYQEDTELNKFNKIYVMPLLAPKDIGKSKSSTLMAYSFIATDLQYSVFASKQVILANTIDALPKNINSSTSSIILLVDDFIGTGETAEDALKHMFDNDIAKDKIVLLSLVAQKEGVERIESLGVKCFVTYLQEKGISGVFPPDEAKEKLKLMQLIEQKIKVKANNNLGYGKSEALVAMARTPNNTFPIYWYENGKNIAPFPRR
ncbi:phosphoribosyltransferase-like protein [Brevibacillus brevis]|uniref:phosphoribosyltransferase-like protein n=3 Tax=Brevibacillus brevis TaxID=1393 RepID=UPI0013DFEF9F|nr:uracil phosphoribosyltransferase [Brevibacillus brevis]